jgi:hypothetical protein
MSRENRRSTMGGTLSFGPVDTNEKVINMMQKKKYDM